MKDQPGEEVQSLAGKIDKAAMGQNISRSKPVKAKARKPAVPQEWAIKGGNILEEKFDNAIFYRPKTNDNKIIYENYLGKIYELVLDQSPEILHAIADEVLASIRGNDTDAQKKAFAETMLTAKLTEDTFIDLCNVAKTLTDYAVEPQPALNEIVAINSDDEEQQEPVDDDVIQEEEEDEEEEEGPHQIKKESL